MAKAQGLGWVDKHVEKIILAGCLLVLIYAVMRYGVSTQRTFEIVGQKDVAPKRLDVVLLEETKALEDRIQRKVAEKTELRNDMAILTALQTDPVPGEEIAVLFGEPVARGAVEGTSGPGIQFAPPLEAIVEVMPAPAQPFSWAGTELVFREKEPQADEEDVEVQLRELPTWRVVSWYPWKTLEEAWQKQLQNTIILPETVALRYEIEVQVKQPDGTWKAAENVAPVQLPIRDDRGDELLSVPTLPTFDGTNGQEVWNALREFHDEWMLYQLQPEYYDIWVRGEETPDWQVHFPFEVLSIYPSEITETPSQDRKSRRTKRITTRKKTTRSKTTGSSAIGAMDPMGLMGPMVDPNAGRVKARKTKPTKRTKDNDDEETAPQEALPHVPDAEAQLETGKLLVWFHTNSIALGREYRCRLRLVFANPLLTYTKSVREDRLQDASVPMVTTPWSPWSDPIRIDREMEFFVTGAYPLGNRLTVTVFTKYLDQWIMHKIGDVTPGQRIRTRQRVQVLNPATEEPMKDDDGQDPLVDFDTGAIAIQFDFNKRVLTGVGFKDEDVEMIYLDPEGRLRSRVMYHDRNAQRYKELEAKAKETARVFAPERPKRKDREKKKKKVKDRRADPFNPMSPTRGGAMPRMRK